MSTCHIQTYKVHLLFSSVHVGGKIKNVDLKIIKGLDIETTDANTSKGKCSSVRLNVMLYLTCLEFDSRLDTNKSPIV